MTSASLRERTGATSRGGRRAWTRRTTYRRPSVGRMGKTPGAAHDRACVNCSGPHRETTTRHPYHGPMKIGMVLPMSDADGPGAGSWPRLKQLAQLAEAGGIDSLWLYDHVIFRFPEEDEAGLHEATTLLAAVAAATERAELGTIVLCTGFRPPAITGQDGGHDRRDRERPADPRSRLRAGTSRSTPPSATRSTTASGGSRSRSRSSCRSSAASESRSMAASTTSTTPSCCHRRRAPAGSRAGCRSSSPPRASACSA